ncbi:MAG: polyprenyl synthetase family protein [Armatimonadota bacterium]|nr:polyprenyl synthetase family protein [Armatimonadota bacterium]MDR7519442.1 polyprenyl synthetase family protein [Armatimonadota bacterium]MDR7549880.1 polyprenyl synthetase family protein [Armatimonadota bacterium]
MAAGEGTALTGSLAAYLAARGPVVERALEAALPAEDTLPGPLHAAMRYSLFAGGKRVRPMLVLASCEAVGGRMEVALPTACAVELIHTYSLIHDDLPSMDNSATRRNRPTCHVAFGEAIAVLAGDALCAHAFALMAQTAEAAGPARTVQVMREVAEAIGTRGMVGGQVLDLLAEDRPDLRRLGRWPEDRREGAYMIHRWKTAALIRACVRSGAILAGADPAHLEALTAYGEHLGLAFQIIDDVLDEVGSSQALGKDARRDAVSSKLTFPSAFGLEVSRAIARHHTDRATAALQGWDERAGVLRELAAALLVRES